MWLIECRKQVAAVCQGWHSEIWKLSEHEYNNNQKWQRSEGNSSEKNTNGNRKIDIWEVFNISYNYRNANFKRI